MGNPSSVLPLAENAKSCVAQFGSGCTSFCSALRRRVATTISSAPSPSRSAAVTVVVTSPGNASGQPGAMGRPASAASGAGTARFARSPGGVVGSCTKGTGDCPGVNGRATPMKPCVVGAADVAADVAPSLPDVCPAPGAVPGPALPPPAETTTYTVPATTAAAPTAAVAPTAATLTAWPQASELIACFASPIATAPDPAAAAPSATAPLAAASDVAAAV